MVDVLEIVKIIEDMCYVWLVESSLLLLCEGEMVVNVEKLGVYIWCKVLCYVGQVVEIGVFVCQMVVGNWFVCDLVECYGGSVIVCVVVCMIELVIVLLVMEQWVCDIVIGDLFCVLVLLFDLGEGVGLVEVVWGSLGYWLSVRWGCFECY